MPKAGNESLDFFWLNKTWSVEEHSAFQTQKINPSKLSNLKTRIKSIQLLAQLVLQPFGGSLTWFFQTLLRKKWRRVEQNNYQHLRVKIDIQNEKSFCMLGTFVFLTSVKETNHWIFVVSKITSKKKSSQEFNINILDLPPKSRIPVAHEGLVWDVPGHECLTPGNTIGFLVPWLISLHSVGEMIPFGADFLGWVVQPPHGASRITHPKNLK